MGLLIPLSYPLRFMSYRLKYWYSLLLAFALQIGVYQLSMFPVFLQHAIVFAIIKLKGPKCGKIVTFESMLFLSGYHIYEIFYNYGGFSMNAVALLMILVCKYSLLAFNIQDGAGEVTKQTEEQKKYRVTEDLSFFDFMGYINFLPTSIMGPPLEYQDYKHFMKGTDVYA